MNWNKHLIWPVLSILLIILFSPSVICAKERKETQQLPKRGRAGMEVPARKFKPGEEPARMIVEPIQPHSLEKLATHQYENLKFFCEYQAKATGCFDSDKDDDPKRFGRVCFLGKRRFKSPKGKIIGSSIDERYDSCAANGQDLDQWSCKDGTLVGPNTVPCAYGCFQGVCKCNDVVVNDNDPCTNDSCDPLTGAAINQPKATNDGNPCTVDSCDPMTGAVINQYNIDDGNACTVDSCNPSTGTVINQPIDTDDGDPCTVDSCDPATGEITNVFDETLEGCESTPCNGHVEHLEAGNFFTCAILKDGSVWCWGDNVYGALGCSYGDCSNSSNIPKKVQGLSGKAVDLGLGLWHGCALLEDGTVWCWGHNKNGKLGSGPPFWGVTLPPEQVEGLAGMQVKQLVGGFESTCVLVEEEGGTVWCWGGSVSGDTGHPNGVINPVPTKIEGLNNVVSLVSYTRSVHRCAHLLDGSIKCWGDFDSGVLGIGEETEGPNHVPRTVLNSENFGAVSVVAGHRHTCALLPDTSVLCWGRNANGQLGKHPYDPNVTFSPTVVHEKKGPESFVPLINVKQLALGGYHTCALMNDETVKCWGKDELGAPVLGIKDGNNIPIQSESFPTQPVENLTGVKQVVAGYSHTCALLNDGYVKCWGSNDIGWQFTGAIGNGNADYEPYPVPLQCSAGP